MAKIQLRSTGSGGRWIDALLFMASLLILGCSQGVNTSAKSTAGTTPVKAQPLALLALTPSILPHHNITPNPKPKTPNSELTPTTFTPPAPTPTPVSSPTTTPAPTPTLWTLISISSPTTTPMPMPTTSSPTTTPVPWPAADRPPDRIIAPAIGLDASVVEIGWHLVERNNQMISEWDVADHAAGFHKGSAYPGSVGSTVLSGHHNIRGEVFRHLIELQPGDLVFLYVGKQEYQYTVQQVFLIPEKNVSPEQRRENARWIGYFPDERLTLVTCWPYTSNTHRVIVIAYLAERGS